MKKARRIFLMVVAVLMLSSGVVFAAPKGYMEVKLTAKNFSKYLYLKKFKNFDGKGKYMGYSHCFCSKILKKGYYLYGYKKVNYEGVCKYREKYSYKVNGKKKWNVFNEKRVFMAIDSLDINVNALSGDTIYDYKYAKATGLKIKKAKGKLIFAKPSNVIGVEKDITGVVKVKLKYPYDKYTDYEQHYDEEKQQYVIDYYYIYARSIGTTVIA